jgi:uncharacterized membrane protein
MMVGGWLVMVLLPIVVVAVVVWALSAWGRAVWVRGGQDAKQRSVPLILEGRFARGEVDREEFERPRAILGRS